MAKPQRYDDGEDVMSCLARTSSSGPSRSPQVSQLQASRKRMNWEEAIANQPVESQDDLNLESKRRRLDDSSQPAAEVDVFREANMEAGERCIICLMGVRDRTLVGPCGHDGFCFTCIGLWSNQSRKCPLCSAAMAPFFLHDLDRPTPTKFYLPPLPEPKTLPSTAVGSSSSQAHVFRPLRPDEDLRGGQRAEPTSQVEVDQLDEQVKRRKEVYQYGLFAKHVASNPLTHYRPSLTPRHFTIDSDLVKRATVFLRRELRVWSIDDVEFLTTYIISLLKAVDIRSEPAVRLLAEFLERRDGGLQIERGAEQFAHELYSFLRSPFTDLQTYDDVTQYDTVESVIAARKAAEISPSRTISSEHGGSRGASRSRSRSRSMSRSRSPSRSRSRSYSRSRSRSRSRSPARRTRSYPDRIQPPRTGGRRWNERDSWISSEWLAEEEERRRPKPRPMRVWGDGLGVGEARLRSPGARPRAQGEAAGVELLPEDKSRGRRTALYDSMPIDTPSRDVTQAVPPETPVLSIRGRAAATRQDTLTRLDQEKSAVVPDAAKSLVATPTKEAPIKNETSSKERELQERLRAKLMLAKANAITPDAKARALKEKLLARKRLSVSGAQPAEEAVAAAAPTS